MMRKRNVLSLMLCLGLLLSFSAACSSSDDDDPADAGNSTISDKSAEISSQTPQGGEQVMSFKITSPSFETGQTIPQKYTCKGENISPPLAWTESPEGTRSFALICDDPDAPSKTWDHWIVYNLSGSVSALPEDASVDLPEGALHGENSWGRNDYGGPCPPSGTHRYFFKLYALDTTLSLKEGATKAELLKATEDHILSQAEIMGTYSH